MSVLEFVSDRLSQIDFDLITTVQAKTCRSFDDLMGLYRQNLTMTQSLEDCMAISLAVHIGFRIGGDPLWMYLVGAPSSGKSTICDMLAADELNTLAMSMFTGIVTGSGQGAHTVDMMRNKCVIIKDGTWMLESLGDKVGHVFGELRDVFDGSINVQYRNGRAYEGTNITFSMIIAITEVIYQLKVASLGERFLHCRLESDRETEKVRNASAIDEIWQNSQLTLGEEDGAEDPRSFPLQRQYTAGFLNHLHSRMRMEDLIRPSYSSRDRDLVQALADIIACSRAQAPLGKSEDVLYDSRPESSTRVVKQLSRLALCLCYVLESTTIDDRIRKLLVKVALDSSFSRQYTLIRHVALNEGVPRKDLFRSSGVPHQSGVTLLKSLESLGVMSEDKEGSRQGSGRKNHLVYCAPWIENAFRLADEFNGQVVRKPPSRIVTKKKVVRQPSDVPSAGTKRPKWKKKKAGPPKR